MEIFFLEKKSHNTGKKLKGGTIWDFSKSILSEKIKKLKVGPFGGKKFFEKSRTVPKILFGPVEFK